MTYLSYQLPKGAPVRIVWFAQCDVCKAFLVEPMLSTAVLREVAYAAGWRYSCTHPMDTCSACLRKEAP